MTCRRLLIPIVLLLCLACNKEDDLPEPVAKKKPLYEVMVVFAPGQLGDRGYADNVMEGVNLLTFKETGDSIKNDTLDVHFISPWCFESLRESLDHWAKDAESPFVSGSYERRLLVLTEPYMIKMLDVVKDNLRPSDEVLVLKVNDDDVRAAAEEYGLGERLHGLNISAAGSVRRYCRYMDIMISLLEKTEHQIIHRRRVPYIRLYDSKEVAYRDSVYETLVAELGDSTEIILSNLSNLQNEGLYSPSSEMTVIQSAYLNAIAAQGAFMLSGQAFNIIDLGSGNAGWEYSLMQYSSNDESFHTLVIDGNDSPLGFRCYIKRNFGIALVSWCFNWLEGTVGNMPHLISYASEFFCEDDIPDIEKWTPIEDRDE